MDARPIAAMTLALAGLAVSCSPPPAVPHPVEDRERGYKFVLPPDWRMIGYDAKSRGQSLISIEVFSLVGADRDFIAGLPKSMLPQLEGWTTYYFIADGPPTFATATIGGKDALEVVYKTRIRPNDPPSRAEYWVVRNDNLLYAIRATYPPLVQDSDGRAVRDILKSWQFIEATSPNAKPVASPPTPQSH